MIICLSPVKINHKCDFVCTETSSFSVANCQQSDFVYCLHIRNHKLWNCENIKKYHIKGKYKDCNYTRRPVEGCQQNVRKIISLRSKLITKTTCQTLWPIKIHCVMSKNLPEVFIRMSSGARMHGVSRICSCVADVLCSHFRFDAAGNVRTCVLPKVILTVEA